MTSNAVTDTADRLFAAIEAGRQAEVAGMWSADIAVWRTGRGPAKTDDKARALRVIDWFIENTRSRSYEILDRLVFDDCDGGGRGFVQQHILHATGKSGASISVRVCMVIKLDDQGLIATIEEYFDPAELAPLLGR
ncbi:nuclear transport factor 2 family protein [Mycobacterium sp.]|uniref:nuclear transport factor 2 family protein n=1 Tax=Mycobacterium sp. TaxID=1785 RepID=UPI003A87C097